MAPTTVEKVKKSNRQKCTSKGCKKTASSELSLPSWGKPATDDLAEDHSLNPGINLTEMIAGKDDIRDCLSATPEKQVRSKTSSKKRKVRPSRTQNHTGEATNLDFFEKSASAEFDALANGDDEELAEGNGAQLLATIGTLQVASGMQDDIAEKRRELQAQPESEFHAGGVEESVAVNDLLEPLSAAPKFGDMCRQLEGLGQADKLPDPMSEPKRNREERAALYESTKKEQKKWDPQMRQIRRADQVELGESKYERDSSSTVGLASSFRANDDFEKELESLTQAAGATEDDVKGAKALPINPRIRDSTQTRQLAQLKALMLREQQASKRVKKIKSKTYRRIHRKAEARDREVLLERLDAENPELAKTLREDFEKKRAQLRLMRQRNARGKWAEQMKRFAKGDKGAQREISKQAQAAHDEKMSLRRAIAGNQDEDSDAVDLSESEAEDGSINRKSVSFAQETLSRAKKLTVKEIKGLETGEDDLPAKGILGMNFMRNAIKQKRELAKKEAQTVLKELQSLGKSVADDDDSEVEVDDQLGDSTFHMSENQGSSSLARKIHREFTAEELLAAEEQVGAMLNDESESLQCKVAAPLSAPGVAAAPAVGETISETKPRKTSASKKRKSAAAIVAETVAASQARQEEEAANPWLQQQEEPPNPWLEQPTADATEVAVNSPVTCGAAASARDTTEVVAASSSPASKAKSKRRKLNNEVEAQEPVVAPAANELDEVLDAFSSDSGLAAEQRNLVRTTFIQGTQMEDFDAEQAEQDRSKKEKEDLANQALAGWGSWAGAGIVPKKTKGEGRGAGRKEAKGKDACSAPKSRVQINDVSRDSAKYYIDKLPFGTNASQYEQKMRVPSGPEWNALPTHLHKIKPKVFVKIGAVVPPLQYIKHLSPESRESAINTWTRSKQPKRLKARV